MTTSEACELLVATTRQLSQARREREAWRTLAIEAIEQYTELRRDHEMAGELLYRHMESRLLAERDDLLLPGHERGRAA